MPLPVEFQQGRLGRPPEDGREQPGCLSEGAPLLSPLPATATATATVGTESEGACITPDDLYRFLDTSSSSSSTSSNLFTTTTSYTGSTSLPYTTPSTAPGSGPSFAALDGANNAFGLDALFSSTAKEQPSSAFAAPAKAFDASDILLPFDLAPSSTSISAADLLAFPVFDTTPISQLPPLSLSADPLSLDATLDSPLGLTGSGYGSSTTSPLSEFLASPMFSLPGSAMASTTFSELPLPSPPSDAPPATTALPFFPPLPSLPPALDFTSSTNTFLRPSPPLPTPAALPTPSPAPSSSKGKKRPSKPTGFAPSATPLLPLDAPIQSRNSVLPSATSRKRKTAQAEKALAKRRKTSVSGEEATPAPEASSGGGDGGEEEDLPADIVAAVERKRLQNTLSARKSRARKQARLQELETENEQLKARVEDLERMLAAAVQRG